MSMKLIAFTCVPVSVLLAGQVLAIEPPDRPVAPPPAPAPLAKPANPDDAFKSQPKSPETQPEASTTARPYLGVGTSPVPRLLAVHLGLPERSGVIVRSLDPAGPAATAGLVEYDVIKGINGQAVSQHADLCQIICAQNVGDEVNLDIVHAGKAGSLKVTLGKREESDQAMARPQPLENLLEGIQGEQADRIRKAIEQNMRGMERDLSGHAGQIAPHIDRAMRDMQQRAERMLDEAENTAGRTRRFNMSSESTVRLLDGQGSIELKSKEGGNEVTVRDSNGKEVWSGPWNDEQDKAAAPQDIRERVDKLRIDMSGKGGGLRLRMGPRGGIQDGDAGIDE